MGHSSSIQLHWPAGLQLQGDVLTPLSCICLLGDASAAARCCIHLNTCSCNLIELQLVLREVMSMGFTPHSAAELC